MQPAKQEALETIGKLPDDADMGEIMYRLYVLDKIRKGQEAADQGKTLTSEELNREKYITPLPTTPRTTPTRSARISQPSRMSSTSYRASARSCRNSAMTTSVSCRSTPTALSTRSENRISSC